MNHTKKVEEFHKAMGLPINSSVLEEDKEQKRLRIRLILEELYEYAEACGLAYYFEDLCAEIAEEIDNISLINKSIDESHRLKELCDLQYVVSETILTSGFKDVFDKAFKEVHLSNMSKLDEDGKPVIREDGKILKGPNYRLPDFTNIEIK